MQSKKAFLAVAIAVGTLAGCSKNDAQEEAVAPATTEMPASSEASSAPPAESVQTAPPAAEAAEWARMPFDVSTLPVSTSVLGEWPYVAAPEGYEFDSSRTLDLTQIPFWTGLVLQQVEGKLFEARVGEVGDKAYSRYEVLKRFDDAIKGLGAEKITTSEINREILDKELPKDFNVEFNSGSGGYYPGQEQSVYVLRKADRVIWFKIFSDGNQGSVMIVESMEAPPA